VQVTAGRPPLEPGALSWLDSGLRCLAESRLGPRDKLAVVLLVLYYVRGEAQVATGLLQAHHRTRQEEAELQGWYGRMLATVVEPSRFPALSELIAAGVFDASTEQPPGEEPFELGLQRLLDGIGVMPAG
jgi:hypothetical protein